MIGLHHSCIHPALERCCAARMLKMRAAGRSGALQGEISANRTRLVSGLKAFRSLRHPARPLSSNAADQRPAWVTSTVSIGTVAEPVSDQAATSDATLTLAESAINNNLFNWFSWWWPVSPVNMLDRERPTQHVLLGKEFVLWYSSKEDKWSLFEDRCPHRFAPLSQGRIMDGELQCSYHGWQWNTQGGCTKIPQALDDVRDMACSNKLSCTSSYPVMIHQGVLYAWLDNSPQGLELSKSRGIAQTPVEDVWYMTQMGTDYVTMLEQGMDPQHANFLHANCGFEMDQAQPMHVLKKPEVDVMTGFAIEHTAFEKRNDGMHCTRMFVPPYNNILVYRQPTVTTLMHFMIVPVKPGTCRSIGKFVVLPASADISIYTDSAKKSLAPLSPINNTGTLTNSATASNDFRNGKADDEASVGPAAVTAVRKAGGKKKDDSPLPFVMKWALKYRKYLPHWVLINNTIADQDVVVIGMQERYMARHGLTPLDYFLPAKNADAGVMATNKWLNKVGYPKTLYPPWLQHPGLTEPLGQMPIPQMLDRQASHVKLCVICQKGLLLMTRICIALTAAAALAGVFSVSAAAGLVVRSTATGVGLASLGMAAGMPVAVSAVVAAGLAWLAWTAWDVRHNRFISGVPKWKRNGGVSLVSMPDL